MSPTDHIVTIHQSSHKSAQIRESPDVPQRPIIDTDKSYYKQMVQRGLEVPQNPPTDLDRFFHDFIERSMLEYLL